jgi:hypothetical protein
MTDMTPITIHIDSAQLAKAVTTHTLKQAARGPSAIAGGSLTIGSPDAITRDEAVEGVGRLRVLGRAAWGHKPLPGILVAYEHATDTCTIALDDPGELRIPRTRTEIER